MTKKQAVRTIGFIIVLCMVLLEVNSILVQPADNSTNARFRALYEEPSNTWDGVLLGSSVVERGWAAPLAWHEHGMALYCMSTDSFPMVFVPNLIKEIHKKQNTKLFIIDLRGLRANKLELQEFKIRRLTDNMRFSKNRTDTINRALDYADEYNHVEEDRAFLEDPLSFHIPFIKYHSRWTELTEQDFVTPKTAMKGVYEKTAFEVCETRKPKLTKKVGELSDRQMKILTEILDYGKENDLQLLFTMIPAPISRTAQKELNRAFQIIKSYGYPVLNMNKEKIYEEMGLNFSNDFYNSSHLNSRGARKLTSYMSNYIAQNYEIEDKRGDKAYEDWDEAWEKYDAFYNAGWDAAANAP